MSGDQHTVDAARQIVATLAEIIGAITIGVGLHAIYAPLAWLWIGLVCFAVSFLLEAAAPGAPHAAAGPHDWHAEMDATDGEPRP